MKPQPNKIAVALALNFGWQTFKHNLQFFLLLMVILLGLPISISLAKEFILPGYSMATFFLIELAYIAIQIVISIGIIKITISFADGQKPKLTELFSYYPLIFKYLVTSLLIGLVTMVGFLLLIIPGIIWSVKYSYAPFFVVDQGLGPIEAMKASAVLTRGAKWNLLGFFLIGGLLNIVGALLIIIGLIVTAPIVYLAQAHIYRQLLAHAPQVSIK